MPRLIPLNLFRNFLRAATEKKEEETSIIFCKLSPRSDDRPTIKKENKAQKGREKTEKPLIESL